MERNAGLTPSEIRAELARRRIKLYEFAAVIRLHPTHLGGVLNERVPLSPPPRGSHSGGAGRLGGREAMNTDAAAARSGDRSRRPKGGSLRVVSPPDPEVPVVDDELVELCAQLLERAWRRRHPDGAAARA